MKNKLSLPLFVCVILLVGCGKSEKSTANAPTDTIAPAATAPGASAVLTVEITANDSMKFNISRIEANAGQEVKLTLINTGAIPKAAMGHNLVLLKKGTDVKAYADAAVTAASTDYIPASQADKVIAYTKMLGPKQSDTITFTMPAEAGEYPFICSFPAHFLTGMKGVIVVK